jgi:hypothetical protein
MKARKKLIITLLCALIFTLLSSCVTETARFGDPVPNPGHTPFAGTRIGYVYKWQGRDRLWEGEVINFVSIFTSTHPYLRDVSSPILYDDFFADPEFYTFNRRYSRARVNFFDEDMLDLFIQRVNSLIDGIPWLEDHEILMTMMEIAALLGDAHSILWIPGSDMLPFGFQSFDGRLHCTGAPVEYGYVLYNELIAVNGVCVVELSNRFAPFIPRESDYNMLHRMLPLMATKDTMRHVGAMCGDGIAVLTFIGLDGEMFDVETRTVPQVELIEMEIVTFEIDTDIYIMHKNRELYYWFEYFPEWDMMYVRYRVCAEVEDYKFYDMVEDIFNVIEGYGGTERFVVDLRSNRGGWPPEGFSALVRRLSESEGMIGRVYILINEATGSGGVISAALLRRYAENSVLVGEPANQPPNFFANGIRRTLNHSGSQIRVSDTWYEIWPDYEYVTLMPEIYIPRPISDLMNEHDSVLRYILTYREVTR